MIANQMQIGGAHYSDAGSYQHWDWCVDVRLGYLESAATKYLSRWWKKNGVEDVKKSYHYMVKVLECVDQGRYVNNSLHVEPRSIIRSVATDFFSKFVENAKIPPAEKAIMWRIAGWQNDDDIRYVLKEIDLIIKDASAGATAALGAGGTPTTTQGVKGAAGQAGGAVDHPAPFGYPGDG